jgi:cysteine synthase A
MSAGTGGTSATIGRYIRYKAYDTELLVVDPENSVFHDSFVSGNTAITSDRASRIEGIGRPLVEPSFQPDVIDSMLRVPDAASIASIYWLERQIGRKAGGSTGTNLWGALQVAQEMRDRGEEGSIVTLMCDGGERYLDTYYDREWVKSEIGDIEPFTSELERLS